MSTTNTPTPWVPQNGDQIAATPGLHPHIIATVNRLPYDKSGDEAAANQAFIVRAANNHHPLIAQLFDCLEYFEDREDVRDGPNGEPLPNAEMSMAQAIRDVLTKAGEKV